MILSKRNLQFVLHEVLQATSVNRFATYADYDKETFDFTLDAAAALTEQYLLPIYREMDKEKAYYKEGQVHVHPKLRAAIKALGEGGWIAAPFDIDKGGQQMPYVLLNSALLHFYAGNANAASYAFLTQGASRLISSFASKDLQEAYLPAMFSGNWQGTMALTEPQAGSSLTDITTSAHPQNGGHFLISGQKIYISGGDHTAADNIVHLLLARIDGAPAGTKGISLFIVPKFRHENGQLVPNDVTTAGIYGKMGQRGYVAAHLMMGESGDCHGYLVGEPHKGLRYMFQMMNEARISTGLMATGTASAAYYTALKYAQERPQGRQPDEKNPEEPQVLIIEHADVRRMLLFQKSVVEGSIALLLQCSYYSDLHAEAEGEERDNAHLLLELLTPIAKSYPAEYGTQAVNTGMQVLGGAGYTDDFALEQYLRDIRVNSIYEGTTTIHGIDLLGRKVMLQKGKAVHLLMKEIQGDVKRALEIPELEEYAQALAKTASGLHAVTMHLMQVGMQQGPRSMLADATLYLDYFSLVVIGWQWLKQAIVAQNALSDDSVKEQNFYQGKLLAFRYFFNYELPKTLYLHTRLESQDRITLSAKSEYIN